MRIESWLEKRNRSVDLVKPMVLKTEGSVFNMDIRMQTTMEGVDDATTQFSIFGRNGQGPAMTSELSSMVQTSEKFNA